MNDFQEPLAGVSLKDSPTGGAGSRETPPSAKKELENSELYASLCTLADRGRTHLSTCRLARTSAKVVGERWRLLKDSPRSRAPKPLGAKVRVSGLRGPRLKGATAEANKAVKS